MARTKDAVLAPEQKELREKEYLDFEIEKLEENFLDFFLNIIQ